MQNTNVWERSLLAGIDLLTGEAIPLVSETHKSSDFIEFLKILDKNIHHRIPFGSSWIIILHILPKKHGAFWILCQRDVLNLCLHQKHGSWLNMIESFFSKMTRQMLRGIRVNTLDTAYDCPILNPHDQPVSERENLSKGELFFFFRSRLLHHKPTVISILILT